MRDPDRGNRRKTVEKLFRVLVAGGVALAAGTPGAGAAEEKQAPPAQGGQDPGPATGEKSATPPSEGSKASATAGAGKASAKGSEKKEDKKPKAAEEEGSGVRGW